MQALLRSALFLVCTCVVFAQQPVIDAHVHTRFEPGRKTRDDLMAEWREAGVVAAVAHTDQAGEGWQSWPENKVIHCLGVGEKVDVGRIEAALRSDRYRCIKIYLGYIHRYAADAAYQPLYALAARYDVPVVFHTGDTSSRQAKLKYADPLTIDEVAVDHPKTRFVLAHCGNPWIQSAAEVAYKNPNVYLECSALLLGDMSKEPREKVDKYVVQPIAWVFGYLEDPKKLMFGSDWPLTRIQPYLEAYKRAIPEKYWPLVLHDNAVRVFRLDSRPRPGSR